MSITVRTAKPEELPRILSHLDQEFVFGKGRQISLAERFPAVYGSENVRNIYLLEDDGEILSLLACKKIKFFCDHTQWSGMMIGAVYTIPSRRGEHLGSRLLEMVTCELRDRGTDFAVLWAGNSGFYARLGWNTADAGVLGESESKSSALEFNGDIEDLPLRLPAIARVERIRMLWLGAFVPREAEDYHRLPLPADKSQLLIVEMGNAQNAYALIGTFRDIGIIYEMIGHPSGYFVLWAEICRRHKKILVNDSVGSPSMQWFVSNTNIVFKRKHLAMWQWFSKKPGQADTAKWYIPYYDRI